MDKKIMIELELKPIRIPSFISAKTNKITSDRCGVVKYHISELSEEILNDLVDQFRTDLLAAAKKPYQLPNL